MVAAAAAAAVAARDSEEGLARWGILDVWVVVRLAWGGQEVSLDRWGPGGPGVWGCMEGSCGIWRGAGMTRESSGTM